MWYGYRFYTAGETPPIPLPIATAQVDVDETPVTTEKKAEHTAAPTHPKLVTIPALQITDARVFGVGVTSNGEVDTPHNIYDIGWYTKSSQPGEDLGAVLIDGHNGGPTKDGIFKRLPELAIGSLITIERGDGKKVTYVVKENKTVDVEELNNGGMEELARSAEGGSQGLNLISCTGKWIPAKETYDKRVIVRAVERS